jgi:glutaredoxin
MLAIIWTKTTCSFCVKAKKLLEKHNISYEERNIEKNWTKQDLLNIVPNARTVPQIFIDKAYVGGYTDLVDYINSL